MHDAVILSAARTPTGKFLGVLKSLTAPELGAIAVREAVARAGLEPSDRSTSASWATSSRPASGQAPARQAALKAGLPDQVGALTINKVCGSGLKAVMLAAQAVRLGDADVVVAGGMESMSNTPYALPRLREGLRMGNGEVQDLMIHDGLWCAFEAATWACPVRSSPTSTTCRAPSRTPGPPKAIDGPPRRPTRAGSAKRSSRSRCPRKRASRSSWATTSRFGRTRPSTRWRS